MPTLYYPAIIEGGDGSFGVVFPDLDGCVSAGDSLQEAARNAEEALALHLSGMAEDDEPIPKPRSLDQVPPDPGIEEAARILVRVDVPSRSTDLIISMDEVLLSQVDRTASERGMSRSTFLSEAARRVLAEDARVAAE